MNHTLEFVNLKSATCAFRVTYLVIALAILGATHAQAQEYATFNLSLAYQMHYENILPTPLTVEPSSSCSSQNSSVQVYYSAADDETNYSVSTQVTGQVILRSDGGIDINCHLRLEGADQGIFIGDFIYFPSSGQIQAVLLPDGGIVPTPFTEIAYLLYVDMSNPGHAIYHFHGNDKLFGLAQQMFGVNFTGVELTFDVQAPSS